jgi:putative flippase GtrA
MQPARSIARNRSARGRRPASMSAEPFPEARAESRALHGRVLILQPVLGRLGAAGVGRLGVAPERLAELARWWAIGLLFLLINIPLLYGLRQFLALPVAVATLAAGELGTLARFVVNDRWVFGNPRPTWRRCAQYHAAVASSFVIWWIVTNLLANAGVHYLLASIAGQAVSVGWSMLTNFGWIWRRAAVDAAGSAPAVLPVPRASSWSVLGRCRRAEGLLRHLPSCLLLIAAVAFTFQQTLFFGYRFVGNSDRLNQYLSFISFHTHNLERGQFSAWSDNMFDGFDILSLPMSFFTPLYAIPALLHTDDVIAVFGVITPAMLAITLIVAYFVAYSLTHDRLASVAGACTYGFATYGLLKLAQNDTTYLSILTLPIFFYLVHTTTRHNWLQRYVLLTILVTVEFYFAFLQEFSYNVIFLFVYGTALLLRKNVYPIASFAAAMLSGAILSAPRLLVQVGTVAGSGRTRGVPIVQGEDAVGLRTLMRFFSRDIFGHSWRQQLQFPLQINLDEGDLVHSSVFGALLLLLIILSFSWIFTFRTNSTRSRSYNAVVLIAYILFAFAVMHNTDAYLLIVRLYQNVSFLHGRVGVSALFPIALVTAMFLAHDRGTLGKRGMVVTAAASVLVIAVSAVDFSFVYAWLGWRFGLSVPLFVTCDDCLLGESTGPMLAWDLWRFTALATLFVAIVAAGLLSGRAGRTVMKTVLAAAIVFQTVWGGADYLEGPQTRDFTVPYESNDFVLGTADQFQPPSRAEIDQLHALLDNSNYRSVTICPGSFSMPNCSAMVGLTWDLRLVDGYLSGVPQRLTSLPWSDLGGHEIRFASDQLPWNVLSFLNTRQAIRMTREFYMNLPNALGPDGLQVVQNPSPYVYPRAYFAETTQSVDTPTAEAAVRDELKTCPPACNNGLEGRFPVDYVEAPVTGTFDASGDISWSGAGDRLTLGFPASADERFLVVNETWDPGWTAYVDGRQLPVYATNVVMRGVRIPPGATHVVLEYRSLLSWAWWYTPGLMALGAIVIFLVKRGGRRVVSWRRHRLDVPNGPRRRQAPA